MGTKLKRRAILGGAAASAGAALLAACGGGTATTAPAPTTGAAATVGSAATAVATKAAMTAATTAATGATAPASTPATAAASNGTAAPAASVAATTAHAATTAPAATTAGSAATAAPAMGSTGAAAGPAPTANPAVFKGKTISHFQKVQYYKAVQDFIAAEVKSFVTSGGGNVEASLQSDQGAQNLQKEQAGVMSGMGFDLVDNIGTGVLQNVVLNLNADVTDITNEMKGKYGDLMPIVPRGLSRDGKYYAVPWFTSSDVWFLRKDKFAEKGIKPESIQTYDQMRDAALAISDPSQKFYGWGNSVYPTGDGLVLIYHVIHSWGGGITDKTGQKVTFNSPETVAGVTWLADIYQNPKYKPMIPPGYEGWNDASNNENYLNGTIGITANAFTLYAKARDDKNPVFANTFTAPRPTGPAAPQGLRGGQLGYLYIDRGAKSADAAKDVIRHLLEPSVWSKLAQLGGGLILPAYESQWKNDFFKSDPNFAPLETQVRDKNGYDQIYYPADPSAPVDAVGAQNVMIDMMAQILQKGAKPADAVKDAHNRMVQIFEQFGVKQ